MVFGHHKDSEGEYVEALYEFQPQNKEDLHIKPGDKIQVLEKLSPDWYKGKCNGKEGMFPTNYIRPVGGESSAESRPAPPPPEKQEQQPQQEQPQQEQPQQGQPMVVQQDKPRHGHHALGKFGSKLGNAAIFGVGATLGNDLVDSIL